MWQVVIGVVLTAALGGLLVPTIKTYLDRRRERFDASSDLLETLATSLWTYWKLAMRVAYYGSKNPDRREDFETALRTWDSDKAWANGAQIQIQVSRAKRLLPGPTHQGFDASQQAVVDSLDNKVEHLQKNPDETAWEHFYNELCGSKRKQIDDLLLLLKQYLDREQRLWFVRKRMNKKKPLPPFKTEQARNERLDDGRPGAAAAAVSRADDAQSELPPGG
jgi:hypothetical protein